MPLVYVNGRRSVAVYPNGMQIMVDLDGVVHYFDGTRWCLEKKTAMRETIFTWYEGGPWDVSGFRGPIDQESPFIFR
jgi:hypothetical protein